MVFVKLSILGLSFVDLTRAPLPLAQMILIRTSELSSLVIFMSLVRSFISLPADLFLLLLPSIF